MGGNDQQATALTPHGHQETQELLHRYAHELLMGKQAAEVYPAVAHHVSVCNECQANLDELLAVTHSVLEPTEPIILRKPNVSQLPKPTSMDIRVRPPFIDRVRQLWLDISQEFAQVQQHATLLGAARGSLLNEYVGEDIADVADIRVRVFSEDVPGYVSIMVTVDLLAATSPDQSAYDIAIYDSKLIQRLKTNPSGTVRFVNVPAEALQQLRVSITLDRST